MGCGCQKKTEDFKQVLEKAKVEIVSTAPATPATPVIPVVRKTCKQLRVEARAKRIAARDARIKARIAAQQAQQAQRTDSVKPTSE